MNIQFDDIVNKSEEIFLYKDRSIDNILGYNTYIPYDILVAMTLSEFNGIINPRLSLYKYYISNNPRGNNNKFYIYGFDSCIIRMQKIINDQYNTTENYAHIIYNCLSILSLVNLLYNDNTHISTGYNSLAFYKGVPAISIYNYLQTEDSRLRFNRIFNVTPFDMRVPVLNIAISEMSKYLGQINTNRSILDSLNIDLDNRLKYDEFKILGQYINEIMSISNNSMYYSIFGDSSNVNRYNITLKIIIRGIELEIATYVNGVWSIDSITLIHTLSKYICTSSYSERHLDIKIGKVNKNGISKLGLTIFTSIMDGNAENNMYLDI